MAVAINNATRIHCVGDSWVAGQGAEPAGPITETPGGLRAQLLAAPVSYPPMSVPPYTPVTLASPKTPNTTPATLTGRQDNLTYNGIGGMAVAGLESNYATMTAPYLFDVLIICCSTNDRGGGTDTSPGGAFQTSYNAYLDHVHSNRPSAQIICTSVQVRSPGWVAGPHFSDSTDTWAGNTRIQESVAARSSFCTYYDAISMWLAWSVANNVPQGSSGTLYPTNPNALTYDNLHGSPMCKQLWATGLMGLFTFS